MSTQPPVVEVAIRVCEEGHVTAITTIYAHHVVHGLASFEIEPPSGSPSARKPNYACA
jgi:L-amino acid N-acyltransferase YncA